MPFHLSERLPVTLKSKATSVLETWHLYHQPGLVIAQKPEPWLFSSALMTLPRGDPGGQKA